MRASLVVFLLVSLGASACSADDDALGVQQADPVDAGSTADAFAEADAPSIEASPCSEPLGPPDPPGEPWHLPNCTSVTGTGAVTFSTDHGATLAPVGEPSTGYSLTLGLVALDLPNTLLAASADQLLRSEDAGCTWSAVAVLPSPVMTLRRGIGDRAYAFGPPAGAETGPFVRIDQSIVTKLESPTQNVVGFGAHPTHPDCVRVGGRDRTLWDSHDGGKTWQPRPMGVLPGSEDLDVRAYAFAFDPQNLDHALLGSQGHGAFVTEDGGKSWRRSKGLSISGHVNVFQIAISPANPQAVWSYGIDLVENQNGDPSSGRHVFRSKDGGATFRRVVDQSSKVRLAGTLVPHPTNANVVVFTFSASYGGYGTDFFELDGTTLEKAHNAYSPISTVLFSPADPSLLYVGIGSDEITDVLP